MTVMLRLSMTELPCLQSLLVATACCDILALITSAKEVVFSSLSVCLLATLRKNFQTDLHEISGKIGNGSINKWLNFGGNWQSGSRIQICIATLVRRETEIWLTSTWQRYALPSTSNYVMHFNCIAWCFKDEYSDRMVQKIHVTQHCVQLNV